MKKLKRYESFENLKASAPHMSKPTIKQETLLRNAFQNLRKFKAGKEVRVNKNSDLNGE